MMNAFCNFFTTMGDLQKALINEWFNQGLMGFDINRQIQVAEKILASIPASSSLPELERDILFEARAYERDSPDEIVKQINRILDQVNKPIGILSFVWRYLPDGRALTWPADLSYKLSEACKVLSIPFFDPRVRLIEKYGIEIVNLGDVDYKDEALPKVGDEFSFFINEVLN
jgi:hypothetical protein